MPGFFAGGELYSTQPASGLPKCGACGLYKLCDSPKMQPSGDGRRGILVVGEAPGADEDKQGVQLVGKAGKHMRKHMRRVGLDLDRDCWKTNAAICRPPHNEMLPQYADYCRPNLVGTLRDLRPRVIVPLGIHAVRSVVGPIWGNKELGTMTRWADWRIPYQDTNTWIAPLWHPSYLLREEDTVLDAYFAQYLEKIADLDGRPWQQRPDYGKQIKIVHDPHEAARLIDRIREDGGPIAFDYETNMLKPDGDDARLVCCAICLRGKRTLAYPWQGPTIDATRRLLTSPCLKVAANDKFEERWTIANLGTRVRNWAWDTVLMAHMADNRHGIIGLKFQALVRLGARSYNDHIEPYLRSDESNTANRVLSDISPHDLMYYCGLDAVLEYHVAVEQMAALGRTDLLQEFGNAVFA